MLATEWGGQALVQRCFARERAALLALAGAAARGLVPTLVATGTRAGGEAGWPLLLLQPCAARACTATAAPA